MFFNNKNRQDYVSYIQSKHIYSYIKKYLEEQDIFQKYFITLKSRNQIYLTYFHSKSYKSDDIKYH